MKTIVGFLAVATMALGALTSVSAQVKGPLDGVAGYDPKDAKGWLKLEFSDVGADGTYTVKLSHQFAVAMVDLNMPDQLIEKTVDARDGTTPVWLYRIAQGTVVPMPLGRNWGNTPTDPQQIDLSKVRINGQVVTGQVVNGASTLTFTRAQGELHRPVSFIVRYQNGKQAWGSLTGQVLADSPFTAVTVDKRPMVMWSFDGNKVVAPPRDTITAMAGKK